MLWCLLGFLFVFRVSAQPPTRVHQHYSFTDSILLNYSAVWWRERTSYQAVVWNSEKQQLERRPFRDGATEQRQGDTGYDEMRSVERYCLHPIKAVPHQEADKLPLGKPMDKFGPPTEYDNTPLHILAAKTAATGIVHSHHKFDFSFQNAGMADIWNTTLVTWRLRDQRRLDKVMFSYIDRHRGWNKQSKGVDWFEIRDDSVKPNSHWALVGEDMRIMTLPSSQGTRLVGNWCKNREEDGVKLIMFYYGEIHHRAGVKPLEDGESLWVRYPTHKIDMSHEYTPKHEKNWPMFEYNGTLLFITSIQPLRVVAPVPHPNEQLYQKTGINFGHSVSFSGAIDYCWNFGTARGGTPALRVGDEYLAFFHSNINMNQHRVMTYVVGAYTFSAHPPFRLLKMSPEPIMPIEWTTDFTYKRTDIVIFPVSFLVDEMYVNLTYGRDEKTGNVVTLNRQALMASLRPVTSKVLGSVDITDWTQGALVDDEYPDVVRDWKGDLPPGAKEVQREAVAARRGNGSGSTGNGDNGTAGSASSHGHVPGYDNSRRPTRGPNVDTFAYDIDWDNDCKEWNLEYNHMDGGSKINNCGALRRKLEVEDEYREKRRRRLSSTDSGV